MAKSSQSCGVCDLRHITKPPKVWCTECDEGLCTECQEHHSLSKASRRHNVIPITDYQKLPADILKITQYCTKHNKKYQMYCQQHECPCCSKCIVESHKECRDIVELDDVIHNAKTSSAMYEIEKTLDEVAKSLQKIHQQQQDNSSTLKEKRTEIEKEITETRIKINNHLDKLQEHLTRQLYAVEEKENSKICQLLALLEKKEKEIEDCQSNIKIIKLHATDLQMFLSLKQIEEDVYSKDKFLQSLVDDTNLNQSSISYKINPSIQNIMSDVISFGEVHTESKSCDIVLSRRKAKQAQMIKPVDQSSCIDKVKITLHKTINTKSEAIYGCCIIPDGRMAFSYYHKETVNVFNSKGFKDFKVKVPCNPFDIVFISDDNSLAVTSGPSVKQCIAIIDLKKKHTKKTISMNSYNYGISIKDKRLIYSAYNKGIRMINLHDDSISDIVRDKEMPSECYIATFRDNIYHTNRETSAITCVNLQGEIQWKFQNESVILFPHGIDVDNDGNVYVVGDQSKDIVVISTDGKCHQNILLAIEGLSDTNALHYSGSKNQLLVANYNTTAYLFSFI